MGHNRHTILPFLVVVSLCHAASDVNIVGSISLPVQSSTLNGLVEDVNDSVVLYGTDIAHTLNMISTYGIPASLTVDDIEDHTRNIKNTLLSIEGSLDQFLLLFKNDLTFQDSYSSSKSLHVSDAGTHDKLDTLIDTNQFYLSEILAELRKRDTNYSALASLWARGGLDRNVNQDPLARYDTALRDLLAHIDDSDYIYKMYGLWQYGPMEILFNYDWYSLEGAKKTPTVYDQGSEADAYYKFSQQFLGFPTKTKEYGWLANNTSPMGKLKMKYYGTYPLTVLTSNLVSYVTNYIPPSIVNSPYLVEDSRGNISVDSNSVSYVFSERLVSNNLASVSSDYSGPSNAVWDVGEETEVGSYFSSFFSVTNSLDFLKSTFDDLVGNLNESPNTMIDSFASLKGGARVFVIDYHPNFWIQGVPEAPTQTITINAEDVLSPDVVNIIQFVRTFALFGGSLILGVTTFFHIMKENPLWFN